MNFRFTDQQEQFRKEVRGFLENEIKAGTFQPRCDAWMTQHSPDFSRKLSQKGWIGLSWPRENGGQGKSHLDRLVLAEELLRYGAPVAAHWFSDRQVGPSIIAYGTEEQKQEFLPGIIKGETFFGIGMSEPGSGSDLASLSTRAVEDGDAYLLNGQKIWSSGAHVFTHFYAVVRTDPDAAKHKGISELIVNMKLPGVSIHPIMDITGAEHFNEVFFDNVRIPSKYLVGQKNRGWYQITPQLDYERSGIERMMSNYPLFEELQKYIRESESDGKLLSDDLIIRHKIAELKVEFEVGRLMIYRVAWLLSNGQISNFETSMTKTYCTEFQIRMVHAAMDILGLSGQLMPDSKYVPVAGQAMYSLLFSPAYTLQGGTSEILRNIVAMRGLGLPGGT